MTRPTFTLHECAEAFRANGISISENKLKELIIAGKFPFAYGVDGKEATFLIFRSAFYSWLGQQTNSLVTKLMEDQDEFIRP